MIIYNPEYGYYMKAESFLDKYSIYRQKTPSEKWEHLFDITKVQLEILFNIRTR